MSRYDPNSTCKYKLPLLQSTHPRVQFLFPNLYGVGFLAFRRKRTPNEENAMLNGQVLCFAVKKNSSKPVCFFGPKKIKANLKYINTFHSHLNEKERN
jgi:hypothetical protein